MSCDVSRVLASLQARASETTDPDALGEALVHALEEAFPKASWVGIYWLRGRELVLGPYVGPPTEHTRIPVGTGVCGTAAATGQDQLVADVREVENYLACSPAVRSEVVVLIRAMGQVVGQIDLDSEQVGAFDAVDHCILRAAADSFGGLLGAASSASG
jgi:L-methionine (R)-S-oxide reductase